MSTSGGQNTLARVKERNAPPRRRVAATIHFGGGGRFKARFCGWRENVSPSPLALADAAVHRAAAALRCQMSLKKRFIGSRARYYREINLVMEYARILLLGSWLGFRWGRRDKS